MRDERERGIATSDERGSDPPDAFFAGATVQL